MADMKPLVIYCLGPSPNPWKVVLILEELGLPYKREELEYHQLKQGPFTLLNPNGRAPALVDPNKGDIALFESGAIIDYLIDVYDTKASLTYTTFPEKHLVRCFEHFQMSGQGPYFGQKTWFQRFHPEYIQSAVDRYTKEIERVIGVINSHLEKKGTDFLVGDRATFADLMWLPYFWGVPKFLHPELDLTKFKHYSAWIERLGARPAVAKVQLQLDAVIAAAWAKPPPKVNTE